MANIFTDAFTSGLQQIQEYNAGYQKVTSYEDWDLYVNNRVTIGASNQYPAYYYSGVAIPSPNYSVSVDYTLPGLVDSTNGAHVLARCSNSAKTFYRLGLTEGGAVSMVSVVAGASTTLGTASVGALTTGATGSLKIVADGNQISGYKDGVLVLGPYTSTSITAPGYPGIQLTTAEASPDYNTSGFKLDNLSVDTIEAPGVTITGNLGTATASGFVAGIAAAVTIACSLGSGTANGYQASIGTGSNVTINAALGTATASGYTASVMSSGSATITTDVFKNNTGTVLASTSIPKLAALKLSDMTLAASWTSQTTNGSGVLSLTDAGMVAATDYLLVVSSADGASVGVKKYTAT